MAGSVSGGKLAAKKNMERDPDWYRKIGAKGGKNSRNGGFASAKLGADGLTGPDRASIYGAIGGRISRRPKSTYGK